MSKIKISDDLMARAMRNPYELKRIEKRVLERKGFLRKRGFVNKVGQFRYAWSAIKPNIGR